MTATATRPRVLPARPVIIRIGSILSLSAIRFCSSMSPSPARAAALPSTCTAPADSAVSPSPAKAIARRCCNASR